MASVLVAEQTVQELSVGDEVRIMYNDKRIRVENPLWLEVVFAVYPIDDVNCKLKCNPYDFNSQENY